MRYTIARRHHSILHRVGLATILVVPVSGCTDEMDEMDADLEAALLEAVDEDEDAAPTEIGIEQAQFQGEPAPDCAGENIPALVELAWADAAYDKLTPTVLGGTKTSITIKNLSESAYTVNLSAVADDGGTGKAVIALGSFELAAQGAKVVPIDLTAFGLDFSQMRYSGRVNVVAALEADGESLDQGVSTALYFHPAADESIKVYGRPVLHDAFNAGNFKAVEYPGQFALKAQTDEQENIVVDRFTWGGGDEQANLAPSGTETIGHETETWPADLAAGPTSPRSFYNACFRWDILTSDSGSLRPFCTPGADDCKEDWYEDQNSAGAGDVVAYGVRVKIGSTTYDTNPSTGCLTFESATNTHDVYVYAYATDASNNFVRIHNAGPNDTSSYPGGTTSFAIADVVFNGNPTYVSAGNDSALFTAMAALGLSMYRYRDGVSNAEFHVAESSNNEADPSWECKDQNYFNRTANNESYIRIADDSCSTVSQRRKFVVAHERGHAHAAQYANKDSTPFSTTHSQAPSSCDHDPAQTKYSTYSHEWSSVGKEGFADFFSAKVFNDYDTNGTYNIGSLYNLEKWDSNNTERGYLRNVCCPGGAGSPGCDDSLDGAGTRQDWMRAYWDLYTYAGCSPSNTKLKMLEFYETLIEQAGIADDTWWPKSQAAMDDVITAGVLGSCYDGAWNDYGCHNGLDFQGTLPSGGC